MDGSAGVSVWSNASAAIRKCITALPLPELTTPSLSPAALIIVSYGFV